MTENDINQEYGLLRAARDEAVKNLKCAGARAERFRKALKAADQVLQGNSEWEAAEDGTALLCAPSPDSPGLSYPSASEIAAVLRTIKECKAAIHAYDEFVK